jgi:hypothetical protein
MTLPNNTQQVAMRTMTLAVLILLPPLMVLIRLLMVLIAHPLTVHPVVGVMRVVMMMIRMITIVDPLRRMTRR